MERLLYCLAVPALANRQRLVFYFRWQPYVPQTGFENLQGHCELVEQPGNTLDIRAVGSVEILPPVEPECHDTFGSGLATFVIPDILCIGLCNRSSFVLGRS